MSRVILLLALLHAAAAQEPPHLVRVIEPKTYHLGTSGFPEWEEFAKSKPHGRRLDVVFDAKASRLAQTILIRQRQVKFRWTVLLNNKRIGTLPAIDPAMVHYFNVPANLVRTGKNKLSIIAPKATDDIEVGPIQFADAPPSQVLTQSHLNVAVTNDENGRSLSSRITIVDDSGALAALIPVTKQPLAERSGVVYTSTGNARIGLMPGRYTVYASRGFEYSAVKTEVTMRAGQPQAVALKIRREVPTPGLVSVDTHIHTLTRSGHGDCSEVERMHTIAGEGIELAIATDHNHHANYRPVQKATGTSAFFTSVIGNEVTTKTGHFNAFPIAPNSPVLNYKLGDWTKLMTAIRGTPGVRVVVLNHPRNVHSNFSPMAQEHFNHATGHNRYGAPYSFDAMEVVTSAAMQSDIMALYRDWFAMLNWGHRITAVGSSDTHDVSRFILGQARTYVECPDRDPARINIAKACDSLNAMRAHVSMGLLVKMTVDGKYRAGDTATGLGRKVPVNVKVLGPSWVTADRVELFANGKRILERRINSKAAGLKDDYTWVLPRPSHDLYLVAIATGPGITAPFWESPRPYQPTSKKHHPRMQGATNPVFLDADNDGRYTPPRLQAEALFKKHVRDLDALFIALQLRDEAVATQMAAVLHTVGHDVRTLQMRDGNNPAIKTGFAAFVATLPEKTP